jgi:dTDP-4-amino-4,6-dideoxygalactose transaminase
LIHYPIPVHLQPAYLNTGSRIDNLLETEKAAREVLSLPIYPELSKKHLQRVVGCLQHYRKQS